MAQDAAGAVGARVTNQVDSLIRAAQRGDQDAFEQLVRAYDQSVLRLAMNLLRASSGERSRFMARRITLWGKGEAHRFDCRFPPRLPRPVTNICRDVLRKREVRTDES